MADEVDEEICNYTKKRERYKIDYIRRRIHSLPEKYHVKFQLDVIDIQNIDTIESRYKKYNKLLSTICRIKHREEHNVANEIKAWDTASWISENDIKELSIIKKPTVERRKLIYLRNRIKTIEDEELKNHYTQEFKLLKQIKDVKSRRRKIYHLLECITEYHKIKRLSSPMTDEVMNTTEQVQNCGNNSTENEELLKMSTTRGAKYCTAFTCSNNSRQKDSSVISFFGFPKDEKRCKEWIKRANRMDLMDIPITRLHSNYKLCSTHFLESDFMDPYKKRLMPNAVPSLFKPFPGIAFTENTSASTEETSEFKEHISVPGEEATQTTIMNMEESDMAQDTERKSTSTLPHASFTDSPSFVQPEASTDLPYESLPEQEQPIVTSLESGKKIEKQSSPITLKSKNVLKMSKTRGARYCVAFTCSNNSRQKDFSVISFFRLPKDEKRCKEWIKRANRMDLMDIPITRLHSNYKLCSKHFLESDFMDPYKKRLMPNAVPSIFKPFPGIASTEKASASTEKVQNPKNIFLYPERK